MNRERGVGPWWDRRPVSLLLWLLCTAATYHLGTGGSDAQDGSTYAKRWATQAHADATLQPGDRCYLYAGTYASPNPTNAESAPGWITYIGASLTADPLTSKAVRDAIYLTGGTITKPHISVSGCKFQSLTLNSTASRDSFRTVTVAGDIHVNGCSYSSISDFVCDGPFFKLSRQSAQGYTIGNDLSDGTFTSLGVGVTGSGEASIWTMGDGACGVAPSTYHVLTDSNSFHRVRKFIYVDPALGDAHPQVMYRCTNTLFDHCYTHLDLERTTINSYVWRLRDSTEWTNFNADTIIAEGPGDCTMFLNTAGNVSTCGDRFVANTTMDSCYWNFGGARHSEMLGQDILDNLTATYSTFVCNGPCLHTNSMLGRSVIDHCTFFGKSGDQNSSYAGGVIYFPRDPGNIAWGDTAVSFTNNIVADFRPGVIRTFKDADMHPDANSVNYAALSFEQSAIDSGGKMRQQNNLVSDHNLYWCKSYVSQPGDRSLATDLFGPGYAMLYSRPGDSTSTNLGRWENHYATDSLSVYACPLFSDSSMSHGFDPQINTGSGAIGAGSDGSDIGAVSLLPTNVPLPFDPEGIFFWRGIPDQVTITVVNNTANGIAINFGPNPWNSAVVGYPKPCELTAYGITLDHCQGGHDIAPGGSYSQVLYYDGTTAWGSGGTTTWLAFAINLGHGNAFVHYNPSDTHSIIRIPIAIF